MKANSESGRGGYSGSEREHESGVPHIPVCEHLAGNSRFLVKALERRKRILNSGQPGFDITVDFEDGSKLDTSVSEIETLCELVQDDSAPGVNQLSRNATMRIGMRIPSPIVRANRDRIELILSLLATRIAYITLPKLQNARELREAQAYLERHLLRNGCRVQPLLHVLIETPEALHDVWNIASTPGLETLDFGIMDYVSCFGLALPRTAMRSPDQFTHPLLAKAKLEIVSAAIGNGLVPSHNITTAVRVPETAYYDARYARTRFGFLRMWSIHPDQIEPITRGMSVDPAERELAERILKKAQAVDWAPIEFDGELHDRASYRYLRSLLGGE